LVGVRPAGGRERLLRNRPWRRGHGVPDRLARTRAADRRVPGPGQQWTRRRWQPRRDGRLSGRLLLAARTVARRRGGARDPKRPVVRPPGPDLMTRLILVGAAVAGLLAPAAAAPARLGV